MTTLSCAEGLAFPKHSVDTLRLSFYLSPSPFSLRCRGKHPPLPSPWFSTCRSQPPTHAGDLSSGHRYLQDWSTPKPGLQLGSATPGCVDTATDCSLARIKPTPLPDVKGVQLTGLISAPHFDCSTSLCPPCMPTLPCHCFQRSPSPLAELQTTDASFDLTGSGWRGLLMPM